MIVGLVGLAGAGKSEVARILMEEFAFARVKFADPLKNMLRTMLGDIGHSPDEVERYVEGDLKEEPVDGIGVTARRLMQTLGTEWGRDLIRDDLWIALWAGKVDCFDHVVVDDIRFENEVSTIRDRGGEIWQVTRPGLTAGAHISEQLSIVPDRVIPNHRTIEDLHTQARLHVRFFLDIPAVG